MKILLILGLALASFPIVTPAAAQTMTADQRQQAYEFCRSEYVRRGMGNDDAANVYCSNKYYPEGQYAPPPNDPCAWNACNGTYQLNSYRHLKQFSFATSQKVV